MAESSPTDVGLAVAANVWALRNAVALRQKKFERLEREKQAAARKAAQSKRLTEEKGREKARQKTSMQSYFLQSRNADNREALESASVNCRIGDGDLHEVPVSVDAALKAASNNALAALGAASSSEPSIVLLRSTPGTVLVSSDDSAAADLGIAPDFEIPSESEESEDDDFEIPPPPKRTKKNYSLTRKFQTEWAAKCPWAEMVLGADGILHMVRCRVCSEMGKKPYIMGPKLYTLQTHEKRKKHQKNMVLFAARRPTTVLEQLNSNNSVESKRKRVQLATLFQVLSDGRPMAEFTSRFSLYELLSVPDLPRMHWTEGAGWIMASHMWAIVQEKMKSFVQSAKYIALTADETTGVDNCSYIAVHCYVMQNWIRVPMLISLQKLESDGATADNLTSLIMSVLSVKSELIDEAISTNLICFGADGVAAFQGCRTGVTKQIQSKHAPFAQGVHCMAHRCNLAFKTLSSLHIMAAIEVLLNDCHKYFASSPKKFSEFHSLAQLLETKGLKLLKNVTTRWVSLIEPLRRLLSEYRPVMGKMHQDATNTKETKRGRLKSAALLTKLIDPEVVLGMTCLLPLLESIDHLVLFAQKCDVFICDFVAALQVCLGQLFKLYVDNDQAFAGEEFWSFRQLLQCSHDQIHLKWMPLAIDLNTDSQSAHLAFVAGNDTIFAMHEGHYVTRENFTEIVSAVKAECTGAAQQLIQELKSRFPSDGLMDALGVVYPQYWLQSGCEVSFRKHLEVIKKHFGEPRWVLAKDGSKLVPPLLDSFQLECQQPLFKLAMLSNSMTAMEPPFVVNPLTKLWRLLDANSALATNFSEYVKLAEIAMVQVLGSVEDERCFSALSFLKDKVRNRLDANLSVVVGMKAQQVYTLSTFPYEECFQLWLSSTERQRYGVTG